MAWLSFIELDKAVVRVIRLASCLIVVSVCLPSDALSVPTVLLSFSYLGRISSRLLQQSAVNPIKKCK